MYVNMLFAIHMLGVAVKPYRNLLLKQENKRLVLATGILGILCGKTLKGTKPA